MSEAAETCRLDVWLWRARFLKTRALAARFIEEGRVRIGRGASEVRIEKAGRAIKPGDEILFVMGGRARALRVVACGERRGPAAEAQGLYEEIA
ncbi:MAG: RNA-binding S4 domain-containing protein [Caulobacteraceae bacterium]